MSQAPISRRRAYALAYLQISIIVFGIYGALNHSDMVLFWIILGLSIAYYAIVPFKRYRKDEPPT